MLHQNHHRRSKLQERRAANQFGGSVTPGSGNGWIQKADVRAPKILIECKTTLADSYSIKKAIWQKLAREALMDDREPVLLIDVNGLELAVVDQGYLKELQYGTQAEEGSTGQLG